MKLSILCCLLLLSFSFTSLGSQLQLLHTNDLHGFFEDSGFDPHLGGYINVKNVILQETKKAKAEGISTLSLNGGDFLEGHIDYMADQGKGTLEAFNEMPFDAVVLGNHDWYMGPTQLNQTMKEVPVLFPLLAANFLPGANYPELNRNLRPYKIFELEGVKIAVVGVTTNERFYSWLIQDIELLDPIDVANSWASKLKESGQADVVIALTHIGLRQDTKLAKKSQYIDLIVGGHSHTLLKEPLLIQNLLGVNVPIVQAGAHGKWVGKMLLSVRPDKTLKIDDYQIISVVNNSPLTGDAVEGVIEKSLEEVEHMYGKEWLEQKVGYSYIDLKNTTKVPSVWGFFISDAMKEAVSADASMHMAEFCGHELKAGDLTRRQIFNAYPRVFDFEKHHYGWRVATSEMRGFALKWAVRLAIWSGYSLHISGITFDLEKGLAGALWPKNFKINGEKLKRFKKYKMAFPEGFLQASFALTKWAKILFHAPQFDNATIQDAIVDKLQRDGAISGMDKSSDYQNVHMMVPQGQIK